MTNNIKTVLIVLIVTSGLCTVLNIVADAQNKSNEAVIKCIASGSSPLVCKASMIE